MERYGTSTGMPYSWCPVCIFFKPFRGFFRGGYYEWTILLEESRKNSDARPLQQSLVGGWATPLKNTKVNWDDYSQYMGK